MLLNALPSHLLDDDSRVIVVASATPGEGASTLAREIAVLIAGRFARTVLLIHVVDSLHAGPGLEATAHGNVPIDSVVKPDPTMPKLSTADLCIGESRAGLLFDGDELELVFARAAKFARLVIIDAPAILSGVTAAALASKTFGVLLVVRAEKTRAPTLERARQVIERNGGRILGAILNK
jgi:Mrp family chromosome partitioning ATPase